MQTSGPLLTCLIICLLSAGICADDGNVLSPEDMNTTVFYHNHARKQVNPPATNMLQMEYDNDLAIIAQEDANKCVMTPNHQHSTTKFPNIGQNMFFTATGYSNGHKFWQAISYWNQNVKEYSYTNDRCKSNCDPYWQMMWADAYAVGCAISNCKNVVINNVLDGLDGDIVVCHYGPMGDYANEPPYKTGEACSECPEGKTCVGCGATQLHIQLALFFVLIAHSIFALFF